MEFDIINNNNNNAYPFKLINTAECSNYLAFKPHKPIFCMKLSISDDR